MIQKYFRLFTGCMLMLLSACAITDLSQMQTAVPLGKYTIEPRMQFGQGLNLYTCKDFSEIYDEIAASDTGHYFFDFDEQEPWLKWGKKATAATYGFGTSMGVGSRTDLYASLLYTAGVGYKVGIKQLIRKRGNNYIAILPMYSTTSGWHETRVSHSGQVTFDANDKHRINEIDLQLLFTQVIKNDFMFTLSPHTSLTRLKRTYNNKKYGPYWISHSGVKMNCKYLLKRGFFSWEIGLEMVPVNTGKLSVVPNVGIALGTRIGRKPTY